MSVLGIDIGTLNSVIATVQRGSVTVVRTELADRVTPSIVIFTDHQRQMGDHALPLVRTNLKNTCRSFKNLLGELYHDNPRVERERTFSYGNLAAAENGLVGFRVLRKDQEEVISVTRVMAAYLTKLQQVAEASLKKPVAEAVIAVPAWYRDANRGAMLEAARISGLKCLRIISDMAATVLDYGLFRRQHFSETPTHVAFVGIGHSAATVCISSFTSSHCETLSEICSSSLGGRDMDNLIVQHYASLFEKQYKVNPMENLKARFKLEEQAEKAKKIVSANTETVFHIECLIDDMDVSGPFTRDMFEELCSVNLKPQLAQLLADALKKSGLSAKDLTSVEITGGCTRIPWVQRCIFDAYQLEVSKTMSADETVARGCSLQAAMASIHFKVKDYGFGEKTQFPIALTWTGGDEPVGVEDIAEDAMQADEIKVPVEKLSKSHILIPISTDTNTTRKITFKRNGPFKVVASYADIDPSHPASALGSCDIDLPVSAEPSEVQLFCNLNYSGLITFSKVCVKRTRQVERVVPVARAEGAPAEGSDPTNADADGAKQATEKKLVTEHYTVDVNFTVTQTPGRYSPAEIEQFTDAELNMINDDRLQREKLELLNEFETYVYALRNDLGATVKDFVDPKDRDGILGALEQAENWIYDNQADPLLHKSAVLVKLTEIKDLGNPIYFRYEQYSERTAAKQRLLSVIQDSRTASNSQDAQYSHIAPGKKMELIEAAAQAEEWVTKEVAHQNTLPLWVNPTVTAEDIEAKRHDLTSFARKILTVPKPKPTPASEPAPQAPCAEGEADMEADSPPSSNAPTPDVAGN